jgi:hypothetical protein
VRRRRVSIRRQADGLRSRTAVPGGVRGHLPGCLLYARTRPIACRFPPIKNAPAAWKILVQHTTWGASRRPELYRKSLGCSKGNVRERLTMRGSAESDSGFPDECDHSRTSSSAFAFTDALTGDVAVPGSGIAERTAPTSTGPAVSKTRMSATIGVACKMSVDGVAMSAARIGRPWCMTT